MRHKPYFDHQEFNSPRDPRRILPDEILLDVLGYLDENALLRASESSRSWRHICLDQRLWKRIYLREDHDYDNGSEDVWGFLMNGTTIQDLHLITKETADWYFLCKQRKRVQENWSGGRSKMFSLPNRAHPGEGHTQPIHAIHQEGQWLVSGGKDKTIRRWNLEKQRLIKPPLYGHSGEVLALQYSIEEDLIVSGCTHATLILWKFSSGQLLHKIENAHDEGISSVWFNGEFILTGSKDGSIKVWSRAHTVPRICSSNNGFIRNLSESRPKSNYVCEVALDVVSILKGHVGFVCSLTIHQGYIVSASADQTTKVWTLATGQCLKTFGNPSSVAHVYLNGWNTAVGGRPHRVNVFDPATGNDVACLKGDKDMLTAIQVVSNGSKSRRIISGSFEGAIVVWQNTTGKEWESQHRIDISKAISENERQHHMEAIRTARSTRRCLHKLRLRTQGSSVLSELSLNGISKSRMIRSLRKDAIYQSRLISGVEKSVEIGSSHMGSCGNDQELHSDDNLLRGSLVEQSLTHTPIALRQMRVRKIQCDRTRIICSTGGPTILGWDFANEDADIVTARRCLQGLMEASIVRQLEKGSKEVQ